MKNILNIIVIIMVVGFFVGCGAQVDMKGYIDGSKIEVRVEKTMGEIGGTHYVNNSFKTNGEIGGTHFIRNSFRVNGEIGGTHFTNTNKSNVSDVFKVDVIGTSSSTLAQTDLLITYGDLKFTVQTDNLGGFRFFFFADNIDEELQISVLDLNSGNAIDSISLKF